MPNHKGSPTFWDKNLPQEQRLELARKCQAETVRVIGNHPPIMMLAYMLSQVGHHQTTLGIVTGGLLSKDEQREIMKAEDEGRAPDVGTVLASKLIRHPEAEEKLSKSITQSAGAMHELDATGRTAALYLMAGLYIANPDHFDYNISSQMLAEEWAVQRRKAAKSNG